MLRRNRAVRNKIASYVGDQAIYELERWNDGKLDSLAGYGVELSEVERDEQERVFEFLSGGARPSSRGTLTATVHAKLGRKL